MKHQKCIICGERGRALNLCENHYQGWKHHKKKYGTTYGAYVDWKTKCSL